MLKKKRDKTTKAKTRERQIPIEARLNIGIYSLVLKARAAKVDQLELGVLRIQKEDVFGF